MPHATQIIELEGYFAEGVLGIFKIIRGFADLRDLAVMSSAGDQWDESGSCAISAS